MKKINRRSFLKIAAACGAAGALAACGAGSSSTAAPAASTAASSAVAAGANYTVYLITMDQMDAHWQKLNSGCETAVKELADKGTNITYKWLAPETKDNQKQIENIETAITDGANAILLAANDATAANNAIQEAMDAGITIIYVDSPASLKASATFSTDNEAAGKQAGEILLKALQDAGTTSGDIGIIGVLSSTDSCVKREYGFRGVFDGSDFTIRETQYMEGDASKSQDAAANMINDGVIALYGVNEGSSVGVGNAVKDSGKSILAVGFDASSAVCDLISGGYLVAAMAQNPAVMGHDGLMAAVDVLGGKDLGGAVTDTGVTAVTKDNVADFQ